MIRIRRRRRNLEFMNSFTLSHSVSKNLVLLSICGEWHKIRSFLSFSVDIFFFLSLSLEKTTHAYTENNES